MKMTLLIAGLFLLVSCQTAEKTAPSPDPVINADILFSKTSLEKGWVQAFLEFAGDSVVLLRPKAPPIEGKMFLIAYLAEYGDSTSTITWEPLNGYIAMSGELGYTYGIWTLVSDDGSSQKGTYASIWRKNDKGEWKYELDTGNTGLTDF